MLHQTNPFDNFYWLENNLDTSASILNENKINIKGFRIFGQLFEIKITKIDFAQ